MGCQRQRYGRELRLLVHPAYNSVRNEYTLFPWKRNLARGVVRFKSSVALPNSCENSLGQGKEKREIFNIRSWARTGLSAR
jgi:hypothetical protein